MTGPAEQFVVAAERLVDRLRSFSVTRFAASATPVEGLPAGTKATAVTWLVGELAILGGRAGTGAPPDARPAVLPAHGLADQVAVLAADLVDAPGFAVVAAEALAAVRRTRTAIES